MPDLRAGSIDDLENRQALRFRFGGVLSQTPDDVLHIDDGVVDQLADGNREAAEAHAVDRETEAVHRNDRGDQRQRQCEQRNDRGSHVHQEHNDHDDDEGGAFDERREQVVERLLDEVRLPEQIAMNLHALRQRALNVVERGVDSLGEFQRVHGGLLLDADDDGRLGVVRPLSALDRGAFADDADVADQDRAPHRLS